MIGATVSLGERRRLRERAVSYIDGKFSNNPVIRDYLKNVLSKARTETQIRGVSIMAAFVAALEPPQISLEVAREVKSRRITREHYNWEIAIQEHFSGSERFMWLAFTNSLISQNCERGFREELRLHILRIKRMINQTAA